MGFSRGLKLLQVHAAFHEPRVAEPIVLSTSPSTLGDELANTMGSRYRLADTAVGRAHLAPKSRIALSKRSGDATSSTLYREVGHQAVVEHQPCQISSNCVALPIVAERPSADSSNRAKQRSSARC